MPKPKKKSSTDESTYMLMLGLFLILLAFFILLNAISNIAQERVEQVSQGLAKGFGFRHSVTISPQEDNVGLDKVYAEVKNNIRQSFETYLPLNDFQVEEGKEDLSFVYLRPQAFYREGSWRLLSSRVAFFQSLATLLKEDNPGLELYLDIRTPERPEARMPPGTTALDLGGYRATQFARALIERDVGAGQLTTGVSESQRQRIILSFRTVVTDEATALKVTRGKRR